MNSKFAFLFLSFIILFSSCSFDSEGDAAKVLTISDELLVQEVQVKTVVGDMYTIIGDDFDTGLTDISHYIFTDGKSYKLITEDNNLAEFNGNTVEITGLIKENDILVDSIQTSSLQSNLEPWPQTLGNQNYVVVYLVNGEEDSSFDPINFTNISFGLTNQYVADASFGIASVSAGFVKSFPFDNSLCEIYDIFDYAVGQIDPFVDFTQYDGLIVYSPEVECAALGAGALGKIPTLTNEGEINLYQLWHFSFPYYSSNPENSFNVLIHEMGHNFGLMHAFSLSCGEFPYRKSFDDNCLFSEYGSLFDVMGNSDSVNPYSLRNKLHLGWIEESEVWETNEGNYLLNSVDKESSVIFSYGLKIPIKWGRESLFVIDENSADMHNILEQYSFNFFIPTHYFIEYRTNFNKEYSLSTRGFDYVDDTYNLLLSNIDRGLLITLGNENDFYYGDDGLPLRYLPSFTYTLGMHPNIQICNPGLSYCQTGDYISRPFSFLLEGETYYDALNRMTITLVEARDRDDLEDIYSNVAVVTVQDYFSCGDGIKDSPNTDGQYEQCDDGNLLSGDGCSKYCKNEKNSRKIQYEETTNPDY